MEGIQVKINKIDAISLININYFEADVFLKLFYVNGKSYISL